MSVKRRYGLTAILTAIVLLAIAGTVLAFGTQWSTHFDSGGDLNQWDEFLIGSCSGQDHGVSGSSVRMRADHGTECFGAYYRDNAGHPGTFPNGEDVRVMWRWRYPEWGWMGTQAGQLTGRYGGPLYYGISAVDNDSRDYAHDTSYGAWGSWDITNPKWRTSSRDTGWHVSTFDFICDGQQMYWHADGSRYHQVTNGTALPANHESRPYQFWFGNLLSTGGIGHDWTGFDIDYVYVYSVPRPQMNTPSPGSGGTQAVSWNAVANTPQPGGASWGIEYQVRACTDPNCSSVADTSSWQSGTDYTFSGLDVNRTYYYEARARWVGTPELVTCWGNTVNAQSQGIPEVSVAKSATAEAGPGEVISYTVVVQNPGSSAASGVQVSDPIPQYVTNPANISDGGTVAGNEIVWNLGSLNAGQSRTLSWQGTVETGIGAEITEIVNVASACDDANHCDEGQASTTVLVPGLALAKSAPAEVKPGETFTYTLTAANTGNMALAGVVVRDPIPQYVTDPTRISHGGQVGGGEIVWDLGQLSPGESQVLSWRGRVNPVIPVSESEIINLAAVSTDIGLNTEAQAASTVLQPEMSVIKEATTPIMPGEVITYQIEVANRGNTTLWQVHLEDPLPAHITPAPYSISDNGYEVPGAIVWENLGDIEPGQSRVVSWQGQLDSMVPASVDEIRNVATATAGGGLSEQGEALSEILQPGLALVKDAAATAYAGGEISYVLNLTNNGPGLARFVEVRDPLPAHTWFVPDVAPSINNYGTLEGTDVVWRFNELQPGETAILRWRAQLNVDVPAGVETIPNRACATSMESVDPACAEAVTELLDPGLLVLHSCADFAQAGDAVDYEVYIENGGTGVVRDAVARETLPAGTTYVPGSASGGGRLVGDELVWELGTLAQGARTTLSYQLALDPGLDADHLESVVRLTSADEPVETRACQTGLVIPALSISKEAPAEALANDVIEYTLTVQSTGPVAAYHTVVTDVVPFGADYVPGTASDAAQVGDELVWQLGDMAPGETAVRRFQAVVHAPRGVTETLIYNEAVATADRAVAVRANATTTVPRPVLHVAKSAPAEVEPGGVISYTLTGGNYGPGLARRTVLRDSVPDGLIVLQDTIGDGGYYDPEQHAVIWPLGDVAGGQAVQRDFGALAPLTLRPGSRTLDNHAYISSPDAVPAHAHVQTAISGTFTVVGLKTAGAYSEPGGVIDYAVQVHNGSPNVAANVVIRDPLPAYTRYVTGTASLPPAFEQDGGTLVWNLGVMAAGETREVRFQVAVDDVVPDWLDRVTNVAAVSYSGGSSFEARAVTLLPAAELMVAEEPTPVPPTSTPRPQEPTSVSPPTETPLPAQPPVVTVPPPPTETPTPAPTPLPAPALVKSVSPEVVQAGRQTPVTWRLNFSNPTPLTIVGVRVRDPLPQGLVYVGSTASQGQVEITGDISQTVVVANVGDVAPGAQVEIVLDTLVVSDTTAGTVFANRGSYTAANVDPGQSNEVQVVVEGTAVLPVTGGLLDPRTPAGRVTWGGVMLLAVCGWGVWRFSGRRS